MASSGKRKGTGGPTPEINVTPLVDVVLVLLIIFMVIAPQLAEGLRVELPGVSHPDPKLKGATDPVTLTVTADGAYYLEKERITESDLDTLLREKHAADPKQRVLLKGDAALEYKQMRDLFRRCQDIGFPGVSLVVGGRARRGESGEDAGESGEDARGEAGDGL